MSQYFACGTTWRWPKCVCSGFIRVGLCVCVRTYVCTLFASIHVCLCMYVRIYEHLSPFFTLRKYWRRCAYVCVCVCMYVHMRDYICVCIHTYIHTYTHTYICRSLPEPGFRRTFVHALGNAEPPIKGMWIQFRIALPCLFQRMF